MESGMIILRNFFERDGEQNSQENVLEDEQCGRQAMKKIIRREEITRAIVKMRNNKKMGDQPRYFGRIEV